MPTDHFESETQAKRSASSQAVDDRHALNVRREGIALADRLLAALAGDDIPTVARILDLGARA